MDINDDQELTQDVAITAKVLGKISEDEIAFRLLVESFRAQDHEVFRDLLTRFDLLDRCNLICKWLSSKECALICFELCGAPPKDPLKLELREFGELTVKITSNQEMLGRLVGAVMERDERAFKAIVEKLGVERYCHYICNWICTVRYRLVCEILCSQSKPPYLIGCIHLVGILQQASAAISRLVADQKTLARVEKGILARDCGLVQKALQGAGFQGSLCHWICLWVCSWRCVRVCMHLCGSYPPVQIDEELPEIYEFAQVVAGLATQPAMVKKLIDAVETEDAEAFAKIVKKLGFERFCHQLCFWVCRLICWRFCLCVCPPPLPRPWFTHVGHFHIYGDIDGTNGLTNKAVFGHLRLS